MIKAFAAVLFAWTMLFIGGAIQAQDQVPVKIISDKMDYDQENNTVIFTGNVHVDRSDFELWSDKLTVFMQAAPGGSATQASMGPDASRDIEKLLAEGKVRIQRDNQLGTSEKATYWTKKGVIVMEGNPVLKDGEGSISGEVITYHIQENRGVVQGGEKQRVQAVFMAPADSFSPAQE
ncbi:MAG TPA: lipopolysaccharide transport periplasmic protein LptA [Desulfonatronum sp.]|nr:lipopolysaccharide transport periplasmic protein LptA [Desulfonatronum sp.]